LKQLFGLVLLAAVLLGCGTQLREGTRQTNLEPENAAVEETESVEPTSAQIDAVKREMAAWAEGRWTEHSAAWSPESGKFVLSATAAADADRAAIKGYCRILDGIAKKHLPDFKVSAAVFFQSGAKIECK